MKRVVAVLNPARPHTALVAAEIRRVCRAQVWETPQVFLTTVAEPGGPQARDALAGGADLVVVAGGDGTVREVATAMAGSGVPLGIVPLGTANLFARNLGLPLRRHREAVRRALHGTPVPVDLGRVRLTTLTGQVHDQAFLVLVGLGHDAETVARTRESLKHRVGWLAYFEPGMRRLGSPLLPMTLALDGGQPHEVRAWSVLVGNCGRIPLGIEVMPRARVDDGLLDVALVHPRTLLQWLPIALTGLTRWRLHVPGLDYRQVRTARLGTPTPLTAQLDGDPVPDVVALDVGVEPGALLVAGAAQSRHA